MNSWFACVALGFSISFALQPAALAQSATGQVLYRYIDKDGKVVISDSAPKDVPFERIETDRNTNVMDAPKRVEPRPANAGPAQDKSSQRERLRDQLRARVVAAEAKLVAAQKALEEGREPKEGEWQPTISRVDNQGQPNANGVITGRGGKVVCKKGANGKIVCPAILVPSEAYRDRIEALEKAVADAQSELSAAQTFYRRNAPD